MPCGHQPWNIYDKINTSAILPESPLCLLFHTTSLMFMCHDVRSWSTWTPTRRLYPNLLSGNYGKVCNLVKVTRLCLVKSPNLTYPNLSFVISSIQSFYLLFNIWHFDSQLLFLSANICEKFSARCLLWLYRIQFWRRKNTTSNFRRVSAQRPLPQNFSA